MELRGNSKDDVPVKPINPIVTYLCAASAHTRPLTTTLSHLLICARLAASCAARSRATFSLGVSPPPGVIVPGLGAPLRPGIECDMEGSLGRGDDGKDVLEAAERGTVGFE